MPPRTHRGRRATPGVASFRPGAGAGPGACLDVRPPSVCAGRRDREAASKCRAPASCGSRCRRLPQRRAVPRPRGRAQPTRNNPCCCQVSQCNSHMDARRDRSAFVCGLRPPGIAARPHHRELCAQGYHFGRSLATNDDQVGWSRWFAWTTSVDSSHACDAPARRVARAPHRVLPTAPESNSAPVDKYDRGGRNFVATMDVFSGIVSNNERRAEMT